MSIEATRGSEMPAVIDRPTAQDGPTQVSVGIWIADITSIDSAQQSFTVRSQSPCAGRSSFGPHWQRRCPLPIEQVWHPRVSIVNETNSLTRKFPEMVEVDPDGTVNHRQRYAGAFTQALRLKSFPFDRQAFHIELVAVRYRPNEVTFVPDQDRIHSGLARAGGIAPSITLPDWTLEKWATKPSTYPLAPGRVYSSYVFEFTASRNV